MIQNKILKGHSRIYFVDFPDIYAHAHIHTHDFIINSSIEILNILNKSKTLDNIEQSKIH